MKSRESDHMQDNIVHREAGGGKLGSEEGRELGRQWSGVMFLGRSKLPCGVTWEKHTPKNLRKLIYSYKEV